MLSNDIKWLRREILIYGERMIEELNEPSAYEPYIHSDGVYKRLHIYRKDTCDSVLTIRAPTYLDLYHAVQDAWLAYMFMRRGF